MPNRSRMRYGGGGGGGNGLAMLLGYLAEKGVKPNDGTGASSYDEAVKNNNDPSPFRATNFLSKGLVATRNADVYQQNLLAEADKRRALALQEGLKQLGLRYAGQEAEAEANKRRVVGSADNEVEVARRNALYPLNKREADDTMDRGIKTSQATNNANLLTGLGILAIPENESLYQQKQVPGIFSNLGLKQEIAASEGKNALAESLFKGQLAEDTLSDRLAAGKNEAALGAKSSDATLMDFMNQLGLTRQMQRAKLRNLESETEKNNTIVVPNDTRIVNRPTGNVTAEFPSAEQQLMKNLGIGNFKSGAPTESLKTPIQEGTTITMPGVGQVTYIGGQWIKKTK